MNVSSISGAGNLNYIEDEKNIVNQVSLTDFPPSQISTSSNLSEQALNSVIGKKKKKKKKTDAAHLSNGSQQLYITDSSTQESRLDRILHNTDKNRFTDIEDLNLFLTPSELELFNSMFSLYPSKSNQCLLNLFLSDFVNTWNDLLQNVPANVKSFWKDQYEKFFVAFFKMYSHFMGQKALIWETFFTFPKPEKSFTHPEFFHTPESYEAYLKELVNNLIKVQMNLAFNIKSTHSKKLQKFVKGKNDLLINSVTTLQMKIELLLKFLNSDNPYQLLSIQSDLRRRWEIKDHSGLDLLKSSQIFYAFLSDLLVFGPEKGIIKGLLSPIFEQFDKNVKELNTNVISEKKANQFNKDFKELSYQLSGNKHLLINLYKKAYEDKSYNFKQWCQDNEIQTSEDLDRPGLLDLILHMIISMEVIELWVNEISGNLNDHFSAYLGEKKFKSVDHYLDRLIKNLKTLSVSERVVTKKYEDELINQFALQLSQSIGPFHERVGTAFTLLPKTQNLPRVIELLEDQFNATAFYYSNIQRILKIFNVLRPSVDKLLTEIQSTHRALLESVQEASQKGLLKDRSIEVFKKKLLEIIYENMIEPCRFIMVNQDAMAFQKGLNRDDIIHLLPNGVLDFLTLEGFDEIFLSKTTPMPINDAHENSPEPNYATIADNKNSQPSKPKKTVSSTPLPKKEKKQPSKIDFLQETKRNAIICMLELMGFQYKRSGKGSHTIYHDPNTGRHAVVPQHVDNKGTRLGIFEQATGKEM